MIRTIFIDPRVRKQQQSLLRSGKKAAGAAEQVDAIIDRWVERGRLWDDVAAMTKHGELRIKNCVKFDLGSGYRLITLKHAEKVVVLYAGSHDDCDRWLENNRELPLELILNRCEVRQVHCVSAKTPDASDPLEARADAFGSNWEECDNFAEEPIGERELRLLFSGLCGPAAPG